MIQVSKTKRKRRYAVLIKDTFSMTVRTNYILNDSANEPCNQFLHALED